MRLHIDPEKCNNCNKCLNSCPAGLKAINSAGCLHCMAEEAPCKEACLRKAIYEIAEGVLSIDRQKCNGCGKCAEACPVSAIEIIDGMAAKCNLCAENSFFALCINACRKGAIEKTGSREETDAAEKIVGWGCVKPKGKSICKSSSAEIVKEKELIYCIDLPLLSRQEASLVKSIRDEFIETEKGKCTKEFLEEYCARNSIELVDDEQKEYISGILDMLAIGVGPLSKILGDDEIEEIALIGVGREKPVFVYKRQVGWLKTNFYYANEEEAVKAINAMSRSIGRRITLQRPKLNAVLPDGSRLSAAIQPIAVNGAAFTVRKFRAMPFTPSELIRNKTISAEAAALFWLALQSEISIMVAGNTGSGKTTTLNALFFFVPADERIVIVEETPEINIFHRHKVKISANEEMGISMEELINETLRMRPDRVIVGEIRSKEETRAFVDTLLAGQGRGSFATFHAQSAREALTRLKSKGIEEMDISALDLIAVQRRWVSYAKGAKKEIRRMTEISEVVENEQGGIGLNKIYEYDHEKDSLARKCESKRIADKICRSFGLEKGEFYSEIERRAKFLKGLSIKNPDPGKFLESINCFEG